MLPEPIPDPIDPVSQALQLVDLFHALSQALDEFRLSDKLPAATPPDQRALLKKQAQDLEAVSHRFTAAAIKAILQSIQPDLAKIKGVTAEAKTQLGHLNTVSKVISIATAAVALGAAIASGDPLAIAPALGPLIQAVAPPVAPPAAPAVAP